MSKSKLEQIFYPIDQIGIFEDMTAGGIENTEEIIQKWVLFHGGYDADGDCQQPGESKSKETEHEWGNYIFETVYNELRKYGARGVALFSSDSKNFQVATLM